MMSYSPIIVEILHKIKEVLGNRCVIDDPEKLDQYAKDASECFNLPELAVEAVSSEQIQLLMQLANQYNFPVTPRGIGTGLTGGAVPLFGGVVVSLAKMNRVLSIDKENLIAVVEPGVITADLKKAVQKEGLFYPPDPASFDTSCIGGNAATNAGGPSCVKYGTTKDYILGLEAVLPNGKKIDLGVQTRKGVVGYDLLHLLVGSEGTLGIITKLILKLIPHPPALTTLVAFFSQLKSAMEAVTRILAQGHKPCALEFLDRNCLELIGDILPFDEAKTAGTLLLVEVDGSPDVIEKEIEEVGMICLNSGASNVIMAPDSRKRQEIWDIRREVSRRIEDNYPVYMSEDIVVPIGKIAELVACLTEFEKKYGMNIFSFGHAGDGNIHLNITSEHQELRKSLEEGIYKILERVVQMGGTISGEHGIGMIKKPFVSIELSPENIRLQREIKHIFDPLLLLNPGKIF